MLIFDQLKKNDPQLRFLATLVLSGLLVLFVGLWWVQLFSNKLYKEKLETQSIRTVRIPAVRGKIMDREGRPLAENRPSYDVDLYLEELSTNYQTSYTNALNLTKRILAYRRDQFQNSVHRKLTPAETKQFALTQDIKTNLQQEARYLVTSNLVHELGIHLQQPLVLSRKDFQTHYARARALPLTIFKNLNPVQLARFEEQSSSTPGMDLAVESTRFYPYGTLGAHLLGYLVHNNDSSDGEMADYNYRLTDYEGVSGLEKIFDKELRGTAGEKSVVVNYLGYRQSETVLTPAEPGKNIFLTIDYDIQKAAETALQAAQANVRGAVVVMDVQNGDILAMASAPNFDPNARIHPNPLTKAKDDERWADLQLGLQRNRATYENYHPGSIFKVVVGMAALELNVLDPKAIFASDGYYMLGSRKIRDTAGAGDFDFDRAMAKSSNPYFIEQGLKPGVIQKVVSLGEKLHLGERTGIAPQQESRGNFPSSERIRSNWRAGDTANVSIGQGELDVTPIQMVVMTAALGNGGKVLWPRLVSRIENSDGTLLESFPQGRVRDNLGVSQKTLKTISEGMLADTESAEGTGYKLNIPGWRVPGKTGTAEVEHNGHIDKSFKNTWFISYAPLDHPRYAVVATVEGGISGGATCVPIAHKIYLALQEREQKLAASKPRALAEVH